MHVQSGGSLLPASENRKTTLFARECTTFYHVSKFNFLILLGQSYLSVTITSPWISQMTKTNLCRKSKSRDGPNNGGGLLRVPSMWELQLGIKTESWYVDVENQASGWEQKRVEVTLREGPLSPAQLPIKMQANIWDSQIDKMQYSCVESTHLTLHILCKAHE